MADFRKAYDYIDKIIAEYEDFESNICSEIEHIRYAQTEIARIKFAKENLLRTVDLRKVIESTGISQKQFAAMMGIYPQFITQMLNPDRRVPEKHLYKIRDILKQQMELENQPIPGDKYVG